MDTVRFVVFAGLIGVAIAASCEDVDTKSCEILATKRSDVCTDPCLAKMCERFCGNCPVKCYQCHEVSDPTNCTNIVTCPSSDHYCYTTQTFSDDFTEVYKLGCAIKSVCQTYLGSQENRKKNIDLNGACCTQDNCNNQLPLVMLTAEIPTTQAPAQILPGTMDPNSCKNFDDTVCTRLSMTGNIYSTSMCSDPCFAKLCPKMCGSCFNCYTCNDIDRVNDCNVTHTCKTGQECFSLETLSYDLRPVYRVGCMDKQLCSRFNTGTIFGKRDGFNLKGGCCTTDLCNDHLEQVNTQSTTTTTTTTSAAKCHSGTNHCPAGFGYVSIDGSCYKIGDKQMTWTEAQIYCHGQCGKLVDFTSRNQMLQAFDVLVPHHGNRYQDERVWTGAKYIQGRWRWSDSGHSISSRYFSHLTSSHTSTRLCGEAFVHTASSSLFGSTVTEDLIAGWCTSDYLPMCEADMI